MPTGPDMCEGGAFNEDAVLEIECRSDKDEKSEGYVHDAEQCHTEECKNSVFGCLSMRGKLHHDNIYYSHNLTATARNRKKTQESQVEEESP